MTLPYNMKALVTLRSVAWKRVNEWNAPTSNPCKHPHWCDARLCLLAIIRLCASKRSLTLPEVKLKRERDSFTVCFQTVTDAGTAESPHCFSFIPASTVGQEPLKKLEVTNTKRSTTQHLLRQRKFCRSTLFYLVRKLGNQASSLLVCLCLHFCCGYWIVL